MNHDGIQHSGAPKYKAEIAITWIVVAIPLIYGLYNSIKAALQLFG